METLRANEMDFAMVAQLVQNTIGDVMEKLCEESNYYEQLYMLQLLAPVLYKIQQISMCEEVQQRNLTELDISVLTETQQALDALIAQAISGFDDSVKTTNQAMGLIQFQREIIAHLKMLQYTQPGL